LHQRALEQWHLASYCFVAKVLVQRAGIYIQRYREKLLKHWITGGKKTCYLEVAETNSVVVEIPKLFLTGQQIGDECLNVNKKLTNLEGSVIESAFFGVFLQKTAGL